MPAVIHTNSPVPQSHQALGVKRQIVMKLPCFNDVALLHSIFGTWTIYNLYHDLERDRLAQNYKGECLQSDFPINCFFTHSHYCSAKRSPGSWKIHMQHCAYQQPYMQPCHSHNFLSQMSTSSRQSSVRADPSRTIHSSTLSFSTFFFLARSEW